MFRAKDKRDSRETDLVSFDRWNNNGVQNTNLETHQGWKYVSVTKSLFARKVVSEAERWLLQYFVAYLSLHSQHQRSRPTPQTDVQYLSIIDLFWNILFHSMDKHPRQLDFPLLSSSVLACPSDGSCSSSLWTLGVLSSRAFPLRAVYK